MERNRIRPGGQSLFTIARQGMPFCVRWISSRGTAKIRNHGGYGDCVFHKKNLHLYRL